MEANALVAAGEGQSTYEGDEMVVPVMSETSAVLLLVGLFLAAMTPLTLLPLFLTDSQGRRRVGVITAVSILAAGVSTLVAVFVGMKWNSMGDYGVVGTSMPLTKVMLFIVEKPEDVAALHLRQQEELDKRAVESTQKKEELLQQCQLMRIAEHNQKFQSSWASFLTFTCWLLFVTRLTLAGSGHGAGRYAR
ncbi:unnamed protein product [Sphagnum balticum]